MNNDRHNSSYQKSKAQRKALLDQAYHATVQDAVSALGWALHKQGGGEFVGPCPKCGDGDREQQPYTRRGKLRGDSDRFSINTVKLKNKGGVWNCRQCNKGGAGGYSLICHVLDVDPKDKGRGHDEVVELLTGDKPPPFKLLPPLLNGKRLPEGTVLIGTTIYPYRDAAGRLLFEVLRKDYRLPWGERWKKVQKRRPDGQGGWVWYHRWNEDKHKLLLRLPDLPEVIYRLPEVRAAIRDGQTVFVAEGEKCANALAAQGYCGTTARDGFGGVQRWRGLAAQLHGADVVLMPDNDDEGRQYMAHVENFLKGVVSSIRLVDLYEGCTEREDGRDFVDWWDEENAEVVP
jgi:hypothetical protein